jgi:hypothetical protein
MAMPVPAPVLPENTYVCFLKPVSYGIVVRAVEPLSPCGTCLMVDTAVPGDLQPKGILRTYAYKEFKTAWLRLNNKDPNPPHLKNLPHVQLRAALKLRRQTPDAFAAEIAAVELQFHKTNEEAYLAKQVKTQAIKNYGSHDQKGVGSTRATPPKMDLPTNAPYPNGTRIAGYFSWHEARGLKKPRKKKGEGKPVQRGREYDGRIISLEYTAQKERLYVCEFSTPVIQVHKFKESFLLRMIDAYDSDREYVTSDGLSSPESRSKKTSSHVDRNEVRKPEVVVGSELCRMFSKDELVALGACITSIPASAGEWVEGIVTEIGTHTVKRKQVPRINCSFDAPVAGSMWFGPDEALKMVECYRFLNRLNGSEGHVFQKAFAPLPGSLCKGTLQRQRVQEACGVSGRSSRLPGRRASSGSPEVPLEDYFNGRHPLVPVPGYRQLQQDRDSEIGAVAFCTTLGYRTDMSTVAQTTWSYIMPFRFKEFVVPFKVLPVIIQMLEGMRNASIMNRIREHCDRHDLLYGRIQEKLAKKKAVLTSTPTTSTVRNFGAIGLVTMLGYRADMSPITQPSFRYCMPLRVKSFVLPFHLLPKILVLLGGGADPEQHGKIVEQCQRHTRLYDRIKTKIAQTKRTQSSSSLLVQQKSEGPSMTVTVVDGNTSNAANNANSGAAQLPGFYVNLLNKPDNADDDDAPKSPCPLAVLGHVHPKECKLRLCPATALVTAMGLRINLSCIVMRPHSPGPIVKPFACGHIMVPFEVMPLVLAMLQDTLPEELRQETIQNSKILHTRTINMSWDTMGLLPWDDSSKRFIGDEDSSSDDDLLHETHPVSSMTLRNQKKLPLQPHDLLDNAVRTLLPACQWLSLVPRDGHCLFRALARCFGLGLSHVQIRCELVEFVAANWHGDEVEFGDWVQIANPGDTTANAYKARMLPPSRDWGDYSELVAAASIYQHHIMILEYIADEN